MINHIVKSHEPALDIDELFSALANQVRRNIVTALVDGEIPVARVVARFDLSPPAISRHLRILEDARLIVRRREGRSHLVHLTPTALDPAAGWLAAHGARWARSFDTLARHIDDHIDEGSPGAD